jgi:hypothetical protein
MTHAVLTRAVLRVGEGRGFVVEIGRCERAVITAAHCLPFFPRVTPPPIRVNAHTRHCLTRWDTSLRYVRNAC